MLKACPNFLCFLAVFVIGCGQRVELDAKVDLANPQNGRSAEPGEKTKSMTAILGSISQSADPARVPSLRRIDRINRLRDELSQTTRLNQRVRIQATLGAELLYDGQTDRALEHFHSIKRDTQKLNLPPQHVFLRELSEFLTIAYLRQAEQQNCVANHNADSCIMPMRGGGIHQLREGALSARKELTALLDRHPDDLRSIWLLNLTYMLLGEYPDQVPKKWLVPMDTTQLDTPVGQFVDVAMQAGVDTLGLSGGVVVDDFNNDGLLDIMASDWGYDAQLKIYMNSGDGTFQDATKAAGLVGEVGGLNLVQGDYDNDGFVDVLVLRGAWLDLEGRVPNSLLRNLGDGRFEDVTISAGLLSFRPTQTAAWTDYDGDGLLDLFIGNETFNEKGFPCQLYHNNGDGTFTDVAADVGLGVQGRVKGATWGDVDNDGRPDLYVSRFGEENQLFLNEGPIGKSWRFRDITSQANVANPKGSFPAWFWDYDNDGWNDILVAPFSGFKFDGSSLRIVVSEYLGQRDANADRIALYRNNRDGTFSNLAPSMGFDRPLLAMGANFGDLDNDGFLDCYFGTGDPNFGTLIPNRVFRNNAGNKFDDITVSGGFGNIQKGHGVGFGDFDNDGDQDIYCVMGGAYSGDLYPNLLLENPGNENHWITLCLEGRRSNRSAIGARIRITVESPSGRRDVYATVNSGGSFGASSLRQEVGLGDASSIEEIEIRWPRSGPEHTGSYVQEFSSVPMNCAYRVIEGVDAFEPLTLPRFKFASPK